MYKFINFLLITTLIVTIKCSPIQSNEPQIWAFLATGTSNYPYYRYQASVCHAFQILVNHGVPRDNIIVMMYDDIANDLDNPTPGIILNKPGGPNVYVNVSKDYVGEDVSLVNFLGVLRGDETLASQGKKVLKSGPNDHVLVYLTTSGSGALLEFPHYNMLLQKELNKTLFYMHEKGLYGKMIFYLEADESAGKAFEKFLPDDMSILAVTSSDTAHDSWPTYWDDLHGTYLGMEFSSNWLETIESEKSLKNVTLRQQFEKIRAKDAQSKPQQYGDKSFLDLPVSMFLGDKN